MTDHWICIPLFTHLYKSSCEDSFSLWKTADMLWHHQCLNPGGGVFPLMAHTGRSKAPPEGGTFFSFLSKVLSERVRSCTSGQDLPYKNFWQICKFNISCPSDKKLYTHGVKIGSLPLVANPRRVWSLLLYIRLGYKPGSCMLQTYTTHLGYKRESKAYGPLDFPQTSEEVNRVSKTRTINVILRLQVNPKRYSWSSCSMNVLWKVDSGETNLWQRSFGNTWNVESFLLSEWFLQITATQRCENYFVKVVGCASATFNWDVALRPCFILIL